MSGLRCFMRLGVGGCNFYVKHVRVFSNPFNHKFFTTKNKANVSELSNHNTKTSTVFAVFRDTGIDMETVNQAVNESPEIATFSPKQLEKCVSELVHNGFTGIDCLRMVALYPPLVKLKQGHISLAIDCWRSTQLGDSRVLSLLRNCPHFICIDLSEIPRRIPLLKSLSSQRNVANLLKSVPNLMFEQWDDILAKVNYLENVMKIERKHILNTYALNRSLIFIKTRHIFLERSGLYTYPKPKADPNQPSKNPVLSSITDTNDEYFVKNIAKLTMEEYEVFQELYVKELEEEESDSDIE
ncbi:transcription termination factor 4, mitochondrial [Anabrus simplex]|uniref:transcription termination factor 4, mitochondrial n=1 Tax=Anabrus simplex TaxID=316456 RepID=UPI0035A33244